MLSRSKLTYLSRRFSHVVSLMTPTLFVLAFAGVAHAQGTMDFSGAQTLMGTFKTFAIYAGAIICFGGLIFAGIRMMREYEAEVKRREEQHKARLDRLEQIVASAPIMFSPNQLRAFLRLLLNVSPYGLFEEVAEQIAAQTNEHDRTEDEILMAELASQPDHKLTGFALRLVLTDHVIIPREGEPDWLAEAETVFTTPQPKAHPEKKSSKKPALVQSPAEKPVAKKKTAA